MPDFQLLLVAAGLVVLAGLFAMTDSALSRISPARAGEMAPSRSALWYQINPNELGFKQPQPQPQRPGDPPVDFNRVMDEATSKFLKENADKIKIKRFVAK